MANIFFVLLIIATSTFVACTNVSQDNNVDYYWRDYAGAIPNDAVPGGTEASGRTTYIGQMYSQKYGLIPAIIYQGSKIALATAGAELLSSDKYIKILCSRYQEMLQWVPVRNVESSLLTNCHFVKGGTEVQYVAYIGRINHEMETITGKVYAQHTPWPGLTILKNGKEINYQTYEILTHNCDLDQYVFNVTCTLL